MITLPAVTTPPHTALALWPPAALDNIQYCYNDKWSCPITPAENRLKVPVRAGEKVFHAEEPPEGH